MAEATILGPLRIQLVRPEGELIFVPQELRGKTELLEADQKMRMTAGGTADLMVEIQKSVTTAKDDDTGLTQFGGEMLHPDFGRVRVRGRGAMHENRFRADGSLEFINLPKDADFPTRLLFLIEKYSISDDEVERIMNIFEQAIAGADGDTIKKITKQFGEIFRVVARELEDSGNLVMYVASPDDGDMDVRGEASRLSRPSIARQIVSKIEFKWDQYKGNRVGEYGKRVGKEERTIGRMPKVRALLTA
jgi:hypothetical protein